MTRCDESLGADHELIAIRIAFLVYLHLWKMTTGLRIRAVQASHQQIAEAIGLSGAGRIETTATPTAGPRLS